MKLYYVIEIVGDTSIRHEPGYPTECEAFLALADKVAGMDASDITDFVVEPCATDPWAYAVPAHTYTRQH